MTLFSTLAVDGDERVPAVAPPDLQIPRHQLRRLRDAGAGVVEEQEQGVFDPAPRRAAVGNLEQRLHLGLAEPADRLRRCLLQGNRTDIGAPLEIAGIAAGDEAGEGADRRQALVAGLHGAAAVILEMGEELQHTPGREILHRKPVDRLAGPGADERQQEGKGVPVALLRVASEIA